MEPQVFPRHRAILSVSADTISLGQSILLSWRVTGVAALVDSVHLATGAGDGTRMIESARPAGSREVIFNQAGLYTFTLTATFGDGTKLSRKVSVRVTG